MLILCSPTCFLYHLAWLHPLLGEQIQGFTGDTNSQLQNGVLLREDTDETLRWSNWADKIMSPKVGNNTEL